MHWRIASIAQLRISGVSYKDDIKKSLEPTITSLTSIVHCLELKGKKFQVFSGATEEDIQNYWEVLQTIDSTLTHEETTKQAIKGKEDLKAFLDHCCVARHYTFSIKNVERMIAQSASLSGCQRMFFRCCGCFQTLWWVTMTVIWGLQH